VKNSDSKDKKEEPIYPWKNLYDICGIIVIHFLLDISIPSFDGFSLQNAMAALGSIYYIGHILVFITFIILTVIKPKNDRKEGIRENRRVEGQKYRGMSK